MITYEDYFEDLFLIFALLGILLGAAMTVAGIFASRDSFFYSDYMLAIGLPLWIFTTVYITKGLTIEFGRDIKEALTDYSR